VFVRRVYFDCLVENLNHCVDEQGIEIYSRLAARLKELVKAMYHIPSPNYALKITRRAGLFINKNA